jgi:hypothetical protein
MGACSLARPHPPRHHHVTHARPNQPYSSTHLLKCAHPTPLDPPDPSLLQTYETCCILASNRPQKHLGNPYVHVGPFGKLYIMPGFDVVSLVVRGVHVWLRKDSSGGVLGCVILGDSGRQHVTTLTRARAPGRPRTHPGTTISHTHDLTNHIHPLAYSNVHIPLP